MLQVLQNKAARIVTKLPWMTPTSVLLTQCGWLSVLQLIKYHSLVLMFKVKKDKRPHYIYEKIGATAGRSTRQEEERLANHILKDERGFETATALKSYVPRTIGDWNNLPDYLRKMDNLKLFKPKLKLWIKENVPVK